MTNVTFGIDGRGLLGGTRRLYVNFADTEKLCRPFRALGWCGITGSQGVALGF